MTEKSRADKFVYGLLWSIIAGLISLNLLPYGLSWYRASTTEIRLVGMYHADGRPLAGNTKFRAVGAKFAGAMDAWLGVKAQYETDRRVILDVAIRNNAKLPLDIPECDIVLLHAGQQYIDYRHQERIVVAPGTKTEKRLRLELEHAYEDLINGLLDQPELVMKGTIKLRHGPFVTSIPFERVINTDELRKNNNQP